MIETAAPVFNSIGRLLPLSTLIGLVAFSPKVNKGRSPLLSASTNFMFSREFLLFDRLGFAVLHDHDHDLQAAAMLCAPPCHNCGMLHVAC